MQDSNLHVLFWLCVLQSTGMNFVSLETFQASHTALKELLNLKGLTLLGSLPFTETSNKWVFSAKLVFMQENQIAK